MPAPFLKWAGGKSRLAARIIAQIPESTTVYHEPFLGGGGVFFALADSRPEITAQLSDSCDELTVAFRCVQTQTEQLLDLLKILEQAYLSTATDCRSHIYYAVRDNKVETELVASARTLFLNRTCYNGLYRVNQSGKFNVPHGRYVNPKIADSDLLHACSVALRQATIRTRDFESACSEAAPGDFVYLDPPYQPLSKTSSFTGYTASAFDMRQQVRLRDVFEDLTLRGVAAVLSNSATDCIRELYDGRGLDIQEVTMSRAINSVGSKRTPISELLISNLGRPEVQAVTNR